MSLTSVCLFKIVSSRIIVCDNPRPRSRWELGESMRARRAQADTARYQIREQSVAPTNMNARNGRIGESVCNVERSRLVKETSDLSNSSGLQFDRPFRIEYSPKSFVYILISLGPGIPALPTGPQAPSIKRRCRAPIPSKGKQRFGTVSYTKRSIELQSAVIGPGTGKARL